MARDEASDRGNDRADSQTSQGQGAYSKPSMTVSVLLDLG